MASGTNLSIKKRTKFERAISSLTFWRGVIALLGFLVVWEICSRMERWTAEYQVIEHLVAGNEADINKVVNEGDVFYATIDQYGTELKVNGEMLKAWDEKNSPMTLKDFAEFFVQQINKDFKTHSANVLERDNKLFIAVTGIKPKIFKTEMTLNDKELVGEMQSEAFAIAVPWIGKIPPPTEVVEAWTDIIVLPGYWESWYLSTGRVFIGFIVAQIIGIPFGLALAVNRYFRDIFFPPFEVLRPIPPLAWVPASIVFWPTTEMSIAFVTFLGAFFTIVINVLGGARSIDIRYLRAAQSMGATQWHLFSRIILPGTLPSIFTGAAVGMGITWEVVLAGEMISGGGGQQASGGLGFFICQETKCL